MKDLKEYLLINLGKKFYGIDILFVENVVRIPEITRVPKSQAYFKGIINLRGEIIAVMNLQQRLASFGKSDVENESIGKLEDDIFTEACRIVILNIGDLGNIGVTVDKVNGIIVLAQEDIRLQEMKSEKDFVIGTAKYREEVVFLLDVEAVIAEMA